MYDLKGSKNMLSSTEDRPIFEDSEDSRPRPRTWPFEAKPRTSKTVLEDVLEAKDVLVAATSVYRNASRLRL